MAEPSPFAVPDRPETMVKALKEGIEYVDATDLIGVLLAHTERLHKFTELLAQSLVTTQKSVIRMHGKHIEIEADMAVAGIGSASGKGSKLIGIGDSKIEQASRTATRVYGKKGH